METKKKAKFRIQINDILNKHSRIITIYTEKDITLDRFRDELRKKISEIK